MTDDLSHKLSNIISGHRINQDDADWLRGLLSRQITPAARWRADGEPDPHGDRYNCERGALALGDLTDEQLANGAFMNYDRPLNVGAVRRHDPNYHPPIVWMTAVKDRIRWLSRKLVEAERPAPAAPQEWREFIAECAKTAGKMVNGNQLSERAHGLLVASPEAQR